MTQMNADEVLIYLRKSRADAENETVEEVLKKHEIQLQEYAVRNLGEKIPECNIYREVKSGETIDERDEMTDVLKRIESDRVKGVLVIEPQRLTRGSLIDCGRVIEAFKYTYTKILTPVKVYDVQNDLDQNFLEMELTSGKKYLEYIKMILSRGRVASIKRGNYIGTYAPFGYDKIKVGKDCTLTPNKYADIVKMVYELYADKQMSMVQIADRLNEMGIKPVRAEQFEAFTIRAILTNPIYIGILRWNYKKTVTRMRDGEKVKTNPVAKEGEYLKEKGNHPPIISVELYEKAQKKLGQNPRVTRDRPLVNVLAGVFYCQCGSAMNYRVYREKGVDRCRPRFHCTKQRYCHTKGAPAEDVISSLKQILILDLSEFEFQTDTNKRIRKNESETISKYKSDIIDIKNKQERLYEFLENGTYTQEMFKERYGKLESQKNAVVASINNIEDKSKTIDIDDVVVRLNNAICAIDNPDMTIVEKNLIIKSIVKRVVYSHDDEHFTLSVEYNV